MQVNSRPHCFLFLLALCVLTGLKGQSSFDSLKLKMPKHYFNTVISIDGYRKPDRKLDAAKALGKRLGSYGIKQTTITFHTPLLTKEKLLADSTRQNSHLLLTGTVLSLRPTFTGISDHNLIKAGIGLRYIFNSGKKGVWFADVSPFITRDMSYPSKPYFRLASTFIYSHNPSASFNWRIGVTKSFQWGNRLYLPFIGIRVGKLDAVNFSLQFPRYASLNIPMGTRSFLSIYSMAQGGMYNFSNADSLYPKKSELTFHFSRRELNTGIRFDFRNWKHFGFYAALGLSTRNTITFYSDKANTRRSALNYNTYFFTTKAPGTLYLNIGLVFRLGQVRSSYQVKNLNDANDLMNAPSGNYGNSLHELKPKAQTKINLESVQDLVDYDDF
jgi:hypothetical protein